MSDEAAARVVARLRSDEAEAEWRENLPRVIAALGATRVGALVDAKPIADALDAVLTRALLLAIHPAVKRAVDAGIAEMTAQKRATFGDHVPAVQKKAIDALLERPGMIPEDFVRAIASEGAVDEVMRDVLFDAIHTFSQRVNPLQLVKKVIPFGVGKAMDAIKEEFDRRLEPEIRRFLQAFSRHAIDQGTKHVLDRADTPPFVALRKRIVRFGLDLEMAQLARRLDRSLLDDAHTIARDVAAAILEEPPIKARRREVIESFVATYRDRTVAEALRDLGVDLDLDVDSAPIAKASWPIVKTIAGLEPIRAWLAKVLADAAK